jgi:hypothetical protein
MNVTLKPTSLSFDAHAVAEPDIPPGLLVIAHSFRENRRCPEYKASHPERVSGEIRNVSFSHYVMDVTRRWRQAKIT